MAKKQSAKVAKQSGGRKRSATRSPSPRSRREESDWLSTWTRASDAFYSIGTFSDGGSGSARTLVYVHGIGNKPEREVLRCQWDTALFGFPLGERSRLAYWVNQERYPVPEPGSCGTPDHVAGPADDLAAPMAMGYSSTDMERVIGAEIEAIAANKGERESLEAIREAFREAGERGFPVDDAGVTALGYSASILPGKALREWVTRRVTRAAMPDVYEYFFVPERRKLMRESLLERLGTEGPFVVIGHSQGSMIAYDVLTSLPAGARVPLFVTLGSPLGIQEVQDQIKRLTGKPLRVPACVDHWLNVADFLDPVAADKGLRNDFAGGTKLRDVLARNPDSPRHPHSGTGYLSLDVVRSAVHAAVDTARFQRVYDFTIAKDLASEIEAVSGEVRHQVLIEFSVPEVASTDIHAGEVRRQQAKLEEALIGMSLDVAPLQIDHLKRFTSVQLTRSELERLAGTAHDGVSIRYIWRNSMKQALLDHSLHTIQAHSARAGYGAAGEGIVWAVLDSGVAADHPHFAGGTIFADYDTLKTGPVGVGGPDRLGHGTHVCGIIAGQLPDRLTAGVGHRFHGVAPECRLVSYKVLDDSGRGSDSSIIKALDHIAETNERAARLVIHGVNLSLGGSFDPAVYGCGHTPLCRELERLWGQGVVVVIATGNQGYAVLASSRGDIQANLDLSIGDPANLDVAIAVGSVSKFNPHTYGVSYFSSRGPTADGRAKPDLVAPGEEIVSCRHDYATKVRRPKRDDLYVPMSGTSMAAPHVSGILAAFLSARKEFIGRPADLKRILLANCTDLGRDRMHQGAGMPNLTRMLLST